MIDKGIKIDNVLYDAVHYTSIKRDGEVLDGENAKRAKSGRMVRDIIGTYYNYTISLETSLASLSQYDQLYEVLSAPKDYHTIVVPYGQGTIEFQAYVTKVSDEIESVSEAGTRWKGLNFKFVAMKPKRR